MKYSPLFIISCFSFLISCTENKPSPNTTSLWEIDSLEKIAGAKVTVSGDPEVVESAQGMAVRFDGDGDRLLVDTNPLGDAQEFTIEIIFNPADAYPDNWEPRFFHIEAADNPNRRITIELRLNDKKQWYLDGYIKSETSQFTLIDSTKVHPVGQWAHAAVTYKEREFVSYVNGVRELIGQVDYLPIAAHAQTSIGARMNQVHWFKGDVAKVRISPRVLAPAEFMTLDVMPLSPQK
jgi:hypothetical protein